MINKRIHKIADALSDVQHGHTIMIGGFGSAGVPTDLIHALVALEVKDLIVISNNAGYDQEGIAPLIAANRIRKLICSYPLTEGATAFMEAYRSNKIELELVTQGTFVERIRCAGAGLGGFLNPIGIGTPMATDKQLYTVNGVDYLIELPLHADFALIRGLRADHIGNTVYHLSGRNFNPIMATAAPVVVAEVDEVVEPGALDPESIDTPGIFIDRLVVSTRRQTK